MKNHNHASTRLARAFTFATLFSGLSAGSLFAASGTWTSTSGGNWSAPGNWSGGIVAEGTDAVATLSASGTQPVNLDTNATIGYLAFSSGTYTLSSGNGSVLTLSATATPDIAGSNGTGLPAGLAPTARIAGNATISAVLAGSQGFLFHSGNRNLRLSGNNTYTGQTTLTNGNIYLQSANALGATGVGNGTLISRGDTNQFPQLHVQNASSAEDLTLRIGYSSGTLGAVTGDNPLIVNEGGSTATLSGAINLQRATNAGTNNINYFRINNFGTFNLSGNITGVLTGTQATGTYADANRLMLQSTNAANGMNVSGNISDGNLGNTGLSVYSAPTSAGTIRLSGNNTYTGSTVHQKGTMLINNTAGSGTGLGSVSVATTAIFGGTGKIAPSGANGATFASGSIVAPGNITDAGAAEATGKTLTFDLANTTGKVDFQAGALISIDLNGDSATVAESFSFLGLNAGVADVLFNGNTVNFSVSGTALADGLYTLATFDANNAYSGNWVLGTGLEAYSAKTPQLIFNANSIQLQIGAIPEPSSFAALGGALVLGFAATGRRRRK